MVNGIVIISLEGEIFSREVAAPGEHGFAMANYIEEKGLGTPELVDATGYTLAIYLASLNYFVVNVENYKSIFYLGEYIIDETYQWFRREKKRLRSTTLGVVEVVGENIQHFDSSTLGDKETPFSILKEMVNDKRCERASVCLERKKVCIKN